MTSDSVLLRTSVDAAAARPAADGGPRSGESEQVKKAAEEFEGLLLAQMLQSVRESALSGWQETTDQSGAVALEMAESQMAKMMASSGGLGIARTLTSSLTKDRPASGS